MLDAGQQTRRLTPWAVPQAPQRSRSNVLARAKDARIISDHGQVRRVCIGDPADGWFEESLPGLRPHPP